MTKYGLWARLLIQIIATNLKSSLKLELLSNSDSIHIYPPACVSPVDFASLNYLY